MSRGYSNAPEWENRPLTASDWNILTGIWLRLSGEYLTHPFFDVAQENVVYCLSENMKALGLKTHE